MVFVVERYLPGLSRSDLLRELSTLERTAGAEGSAVRYLGSTIVLDDEACFCRFEGPSAGAIAEANRRAGVSFDRIVSAVDVQIERSTPMTLPTTMPAQVQIRRSRLIGLIAAVAMLAAAVTWAVTSIATGTGNGVAGKSASTSGTVLASLTPKERQYVQGIASMTPAQLQAAFGRDSVGSLRLSPKDERYARGVVSLSPARLRAAYGTGIAPLASLTPKERHYVQAITSMTPEQVQAAYGTGIAPLGPLTLKERQYVRRHRRDRSPQPSDGASDPARR